MIAIVGLVSALIAGWPRAHAAQDSCPLTPVEGAYGYSWRVDRCEGLYQKQVGGTTLFIASLTEFFEDFNPTAGKELIVEWSQPAPGDVQLRAEGIRRDLYYRMDRRHTAGAGSYRWRSDVLAALRIKRPDIGLVGWIRHQVGPEVRDVYVPLRVTQSHAAVPCGTYNLVLFPGVRLKEVYISLAFLDDDGQPARWFRKNQPLGDGFFPAEKPIKVTITELGASGIHYLGISAKLSSGGSTAIEHWFYHPGSSPTCGS